MIENLMRQHLNGFRSEKILDVGPGYNPFAQIVAQITGASHITYLDCDPEVLEWQHKECNNAGYKADCIPIPLDENELPSIPGQFDLILCQEVLEHLPNAEVILHALSQLLSAEGRIIITLPTAFSERWLTLLNLDYMKTGAHGHVRRFDRKHIMTILKQAGLKAMVFIPTQPHVFLAHTWIFGTRMKVEGSTGRIESKGCRRAIAGWIDKFARKIFLRTSPSLWGRLLPRNYFIVAKRIDDANPL